MKTFNDIYSTLLNSNISTYDWLHTAITEEIENLSHDNLLAIFHDTSVDELDGDLQCRLYELLENELECFVYLPLKP